MNCQSCNARIDYRFLTNCARCGSKIEGASLSKIDPLPDLQLAESVSKIRVWRKTLVNIIYVLAGSMAGMISGAVAAYSLAAIVYLAFFSGSSNAHSGCGGWGMMLGLLSIYSGAYLGLVGGTAFTVKHPLCKGAAR